ncbi:MarR family transcriptional regulator [Sulfitobacter pseudonitzschiae]|nr:MarR family transcriptional regulator [Pseudosulfitobacter pseudonitzschiae]MBM1813868.1 MarR family transcriptional regulator [Pseudosulfitobacter pseudonitzschiae]MBM1830861.1 MarR family transcriptional regulator [Pseudosulfitobacter pseudonitzschiae]MBM1835728.1 MarR family transcriptional regulator [Pseudosulfitobacter pseudonitzschiae]MBM1840574.1 MarR family transcriptional regulator [Pseudosulfitobacter pseudonitzschiae]MBM1845438.1 MarR family transcriptional regulator [Pseudosulfi
MDASLPLSVTHEIRDRCLCLYVQRAARVLARRFDDALRPFGLTNGQFSLLMSLNRPDGPRISDLVDLLGMDRTTLTAALKPLERKGLVTAKADKDDRRARRLHLTDAGRSVLKQALPTWRATHDAVDAALAPTSPQDLRDGLMALAGA